MKTEKYRDLNNNQDEINNEKLNKLSNIFYCFLVIVVLVGIYAFYLDRYTFYLRNEEIVIDKGSVYTVDLLPEYDEYFNYDNYIYSSKDKNIAVVDKYGQITAINNGETYIYVKYKHDFKSKRLKVKVENMTIKSIDVADTFKINKNDTQKLKININNQENIASSINYKILDTNIAKVDTYGNITGLEKGKTTLIVSSLNGLSKEVNIEVEEKKYDIQKIDFKDKLIIINIGDERKLNIETVPSDADTSSLVWSSDNDNVVSVNENGVIKALKVGETKVTVKTINGLDSISVIRVIDNSKKDSKEPNDQKETNIEAESITLNKSKLKINEGTTYSLSAIISPSNVTNKNIIWTSDNNSVAKVNSKGIVKGIKEGTATITVKTSNNKIATCNITVKKPTIAVSKVTISSKVSQITEGSSISLLATVFPKNASDKSITWICSNNNVIKINSNGTIIGLKEGSARITATSNNGVSDYINIVVKPKIVDVTSITLNNSNISLLKGDTKTLTATIKPKNATNKNIKWTSSDTSVASVNQNGKVTANKKGTATITATTSNNKSSSCSVTVTEIEKKYYEVKYYGINIIDIGFTNVTLSGSEKVPIKQSSPLKLSTNTPYVVSFDYKTLSGSNQFDVDLFPDNLPQTNPVAKTTTQHMDFEVSSPDSQMANANLRFFDDLEESSESDITISNIIFGTMKKETKEENSTLGTLITPSWNGYTFNGWYTSPTGGTKVSSSTKVTGNLKLYSKWTKKETENTTYTIKYNSNGGSGSMSSHTCTTNSSCSIKSNSFTKEGYIFNGWTTKSDGTIDNNNWTGWSGTWKYTNGNYGISNNTLNLYAMWKKDDTPRPAIVPSSPTIKYEGETLKYYIQNNNKRGYYLTYIWMKDPYNQIKKLESNVAVYGQVMTDDELANAGKSLQIRSVGQMVKSYMDNKIISTEKSFVAFNASGFWLQGAWNPPLPYYDRRSDSWLVVTDGKVTRYRPSDGAYASFNPRIIGITSSGNLKIYPYTAGNDISVSKGVYNSIISDGVKNTWSFYPPLVENGKNVMYDDKSVALRQAICQIDSNNYVMFSSSTYGWGIKRIDVAQILVDIGCKTAFNLDGGGSTSIVYKNTKGSSYRQLFCANNKSNGCRSIVEGIYFIDK